MTCEGAYLFLYIVPETLMVVKEAHIRIVDRPLFSFGYVAKRAQQQDRRRQEPRAAAGCHDMQESRAKQTQRGWLYELEKHPREVMSF